MSRRAFRQYFSTRGLGAAGLAWHGMDDLDELDALSDESLDLLSPVTMTESVAAHRTRRPTNRTLEFGATTATDEHVDDLDGFDLVGPGGE